MIKIANYIVAALLCLFVTQINAQKISNDSISVKFDNYSAQEKLNVLLEEIETAEKNYLKKDIEKINNFLKNNSISKDNAEKLKIDIAQERALNIKNRQSILSNKFEYYNRNGVDIENMTFSEFHKKMKLLAFNKYEDNRIKIGVSIGDNIGNFTGIGISRNTNKPAKYDIRTSNDLVLAFGFNNAIIDGQNLSNSPYKIGSSGFMELGWNWKTRLAKDSNFARLKYGFSFQWNKYDIKDNQFFTQEGSHTTLETSSIDLNKAKFRTTNLVFPLYFEFGGWEKRERKDRIRFNTYNKFKFGIGGYAGLNIGSKQKLKYKEDGNSVKQKLNGNFDVTPFVYGLGAYIGFGDLSLFAKYDLSETFKNQAIKQNNISLGLRVDLD